jgi:8-oxo-dGTP pyrophosphatase MutT (NUDIX family)
VARVADRPSADQAAILSWIDSGAPLFRVAKPATPLVHLRMYFALVDDNANSVMLADHVKARAWLLPGGHVAAGEYPRWSVEREAFEDARDEASVSATSVRTAEEPAVAGVSRC